MSNTLERSLHAEFLCLCQSPNGTDKEFPKRYISSIYDPLLSKFQNDKIVMVEIGVRTGASVHLWSSYFQNIEFVGIDNGDDVVWQNEDWLKGRKVRYLEADAYDSETLKKLPTEVDVIIDDGPHSIHTQMWAAEHYTMLLKPEGYLFIEDIQGGLRYCDRIIRAIPKGFAGCVRIFDLRKFSGEGDSLVVVIHNCVAGCGLGPAPTNSMRFFSKVLRKIYLQEIHYTTSRVLNKIHFKFIKLIS